jgi:hypothetical protein
VVVGMGDGGCARGGMVLVLAVTLGLAIQATMTESEGR